MATKTESRLHMGMGAVDGIAALAENNFGAAAVLSDWVKSSPDGLLEIWILDEHRLYGSRIYELYSRICGSDLLRFKYHVHLELPHQETLGTVWLK